MQSSFYSKVAFPWALGGLFLGLTGFGPPAWQALAGFVAALLLVYAPFATLYWIAVKVSRRVEQITSPPDSPREPQRPQPERKPLKFEKPSGNLPPPLVFPLDEGLTVVFQRRAENSSVGQAASFRYNDAALRMEGKQISTYIGRSCDVNNDSVLSTGEEWFAAEEFFAIVAKNKVELRREGDVIDGSGKNSWSSAWGGCDAEVRFQLDLQSMTGTFTEVSRFDGSD